ncbi:uncharacterized protein LOC125370517 isoform X2 [Ricinus communis]|uniref:uncharacterized protein LOC125370517 isoform X2 n=1 Tax=Ricinus communis TaxID=3988 RepID=UPI00201A5EBC|nr:uncharacterized protein LOC125370517 isoform X2 [Ricinus communis]
MDMVRKKKKRKERKKKEEERERECLELPLMVGRGGSFCGALKLAVEAVDIDEHGSSTGGSEQWRQVAENGRNNNSSLMSFMAFSATVTDDQRTYLGFTHHKLSVNTDFDSIRLCWKINGWKLSVIFLDDRGAGSKNQMLDSFSVHYFKSLDALGSSVELQRPEDLCARIIVQKKLAENLSEGIVDRVLHARMLRVIPE